MQSRETRLVRSAAVGAIFTPVIPAVTLLAPPGIGPVLVLVVWLAQSGEFPSGLAT